MGYGQLATARYDHAVTKISDSGDPARVAFPAVHRVASLLKRRFLGTHQGAVRAEHLVAYHDEFAFRFNQRRSRDRGHLFEVQLCQLVATGPLPYDDVMGRPDRNAARSLHRVHTQK